MNTSRRTLTWTEANGQRLKQVQHVLQQLRQYWPLTLRQVYYQLVAAEYIENRQSQYQALSKLLKQARIEGLIPWEAIEDRIRRHHDNTGYMNARQYVDTQLHYFLKDYQRNYQQGQPVYLEIWIEKDALSRIFESEADKYRVPVQVCRGYVSVSTLNDYRNRVIQVQHQAARLQLPKPRPVLLYYGDFDPSGQQMFEATQQTIEAELHLPGVEYSREALNVDDIHRYRLPHSPEALKKSDPRAARHQAQYGDLAVELDALPPAALVEKVRQAIERELDPALLAQARQQEAQEQHGILKLRTKVTELLDQEGH